MCENTNLKTHTQKTTCGPPYVVVEVLLVQLYLVVLGTTKPHTSERRVGFPSTNKQVNSYLAITKWPRRFCCQQDSLLSMQKGFSLP
jgi:hypothetical protein